MDPEKLRQAWQSQPGGAQIRIDADVLVREVRRNQQGFRATIFWRDFREIFVALIVMVSVSLHVVSRGIGRHWPWLGLSAGAAFVAGYILVDRWRRRGETPRFEGDLLSHIEQSLKDVEHQIWMLKNVFWWYLLPLIVGALIPNIYFLVADLATRKLRTFLGPFILSSCIFAAVCWGAYLLNQYAVRRGLEPRRRELLEMRESLLKEEE